MSTDDASRPTTAQTLPIVTLLDKAVLVAIATPIAYYLAFQFDRGYLGYFGVPEVIVDVSLRDLLYALVALVPLGYTTLIVLDFLIRVLPHHWPTLTRRRTILCVVIFAICIVLQRVFEPPVWFLPLAVTAIASLAVWTIVVPLLKARTLSQNEINAASQAEPSSFRLLSVPGIASELFKRGIDQRLIPAFFVLYMSGLLANAFGDAHARTQTSYLVRQPKSEYSCAVIRMRDSDLICAYFDNRTLQLTGEYRFLKPEGNDFFLCNTGRLKEPQRLRKTS